MRILFVAIAAGLALAACQPAARNDAPEGPAAAAPAESPLRLTLTPGAGPTAFTLSLGEGQSMEVVHVGPIGGAMVMTEQGAEPVGLAAALKVETDGAPVIGYDVTSEAGWTSGDKLCGAKPATSVAILYGAQGHTLAAFTGDRLGGPGAVLCNTRAVNADSPAVDTGR